MDGLDVLGSVLALALIGLGLRRLAVPVGNLVFRRRGDDALPALERASRRARRHSDARRDTDPVRRTEASSEHHDSPQSQRGT